MILQASRFLDRTWLLAVLMFYCYEHAREALSMDLIPILRGGLVASDTIKLPTDFIDVLHATASLYEAVGFHPPWICYVALHDGLPVGTCGFKSAPAHGRVEIAYFTFPGFEGRGIATNMARALIELAAQSDPGAMVAAQTLPERNASHRVLEKLGFENTGSLVHPEDGTVLEWHLSHELSR